MARPRKNLSIEEEIARQEAAVGKSKAKFPNVEMFRADGAKTICIGTINIGSNPPGD